MLFSSYTNRRESVQGIIPQNRSCTLFNTITTLVLLTNYCLWWVISSHTQQFNSHNNKKIHQMPSDSRRKAKQLPLHVAPLSVDGNFRFLEQLVRTRGNWGWGGQSSKEQTNHKRVKSRLPIDSNRGLPSAPDGLFPLAGFSDSDVTIQFVGNPNFLGTVRNPFSWSCKSPRVPQPFPDTTSKPTKIRLFTIDWGNWSFPFYIFREWYLVLVINEWWGEGCLDYMNCYVCCSVRLEVFRSLAFSFWDHRVKKQRTLLLKVSKNVQSEHINSQIVEKVYILMQCVISDLKVLWKLFRSHRTWRRIRHFSLKCY